MTATEATVRLIENWNVTGKLSDLNVGQTLDLTESVFNLFNQKPTTKRKTSEKATEPAKPTHADMRVEAQRPIEDPFV
jgi:hypothetical protein